MAWSRAAVVSLSAILLLAAAACGSHRSSARVYVPQLAAVPAYKPAGIGLSVDGGDIWRISRWVSYGGPTARAIADTHVNDCKPSCVGGRRTYATATIVFEGRVPCKGFSAYARFRVVRSSNESVAPVGSGRDLTRLCGYVDFTSSLPCLTHAGRAVSVAAQGRCFEQAIRSTGQKIARAERAILRLVYYRRARRPFVAGERTWRKYRQASCAAVAETYEGGTWAPVARDACLLRLNRTHLADLTSLAR
jgi:uncharacterized protein YecT (DUF1311 family)